MVYFNKQQRKELEDLCREYYGNPYVYQKMAKQMRLPDTVFEMRDNEAYVRTKNNTIMKMETAIAKGLMKPDADGKLPETVRNEQRTTYREITFAELRHELLSVIESKQFGAMEPEHMILTAATKFVAGDLANMPYLVVGETEKRDFDDLLALCPEAKREDLKKVMVPNGNPKMFCINGVQFLTDVVFVTTQPEEAAVQLKAFAEGTPIDAAAGPAGGPIPVAEYMPEGLAP